MHFAYTLNNIKESREKMETIKDKKLDAIRSFKIDRVNKIVSNNETILNPTWEKIKAIKGIYSVEFIKANGDLRKANCINLTEEYSKGILDTSKDKVNGLIRFLDMGLTMDKGIGIDKANKLIINSLEEQVEELKTKLRIKENALENLEKLIK
tara:strand:- start:3341 stop:3799 length:459 start_codon:yes stop_codon:yes gene_type:complete